MLLRCFLVLTVCLIAQSCSSKYRVDLPRLLESIKENRIEYWLLHTRAEFEHEKRVRIPATLEAAAEDPRINKYEIEWIKDYYASYYRMLEFGEYEAFMGFLLGHPSTELDDLLEKVHTEQFKRRVDDKIESRNDIDFELKV